MIEWEREIRKCGCWKRQQLAMAVQLVFVLMFLLMSALLTVVIGIFIF
jgi:hypothetical protein